MTNIDKTMNNTNDEETQDEVIEELDEVQEEIEQDEESIEDVKKKLATAEAQKEHWRKKASEKTEVTKEVVKDDKYSLSDIRALQNVPEEDIEEVEKASKILGKSLSETLKDATVRSILATRLEERKTANAQNTKTQRSTQKEISDDDILNKVSKGEIPDAGSTEADRLFWARRGGKR